VPSFTKKLLQTLGVGSVAAPKAKPKAPAHKSLVPPSPRDGLIREALDLYRQHAPAVHGMLDATLRQMREKPPNVNDIDSLKRLLSIHSANQEVRRLMNHRHRRYLVLVTLREMMEQNRPPTPKVAKQTVSRR
jgi:hypothetical protein